MKHLAIIADGNRRWANANGLPIKLGYMQGLTAIERCCCWAKDNQIEYLTVYVFSTENWNRNQQEVDLLMNLARWYFDDKQEWYVANNIHVQFLGRRDRLAQDLVDGMARMEQSTMECDGLTLTVCVDYGGRDEIARAVAQGAKTEQEINAALTAKIPCPDAILRPGGEYRLSNFLLWQAAYAELLFTDKLFPDVDGHDLDELLVRYHMRKRNYGR